MRECGRDQLRGRRRVPTSRDRASGAPLTHRSPTCLSNDLNTLRIADDANIMSDDELQTLPEILASSSKDTLSASLSSPDAQPYLQCRAQTVSADAGPHSVTQVQPTLHRPGLFTFHVLMHACMILIGCYGRGSDTPKNQRKNPPAQVEHPPPQEDHAPRSADTPSLDHPSIHISDTPYQHDVSQHRGQAPKTAAEQGSADHSGRNSRQPPHNGNRRDDFEQLALLAHALQSDPLHESSSAASGRISLSGPSDRRNSGYQNPVPQPLGVAGQNGSYGTLMLGKGGRSKYLGPTAGSEWLKEVGPLCWSLVHSH